MDFTPEQCRTVLNLARATIRDTLGSAAGTGSAPSAEFALTEFASRTIAIAIAPAPPTPPPIDTALLRPAGCFVSLHHLNTRRLRGCVGRLDATSALVEAVRSAAISVLGDPRFYDDPVLLHELPELELEVSVLSPLRPARGPLAFDLLNDGIVLTCGRRSGCFLPQVARETGWSREQLLDRLCTEKMGLPPHAWREPAARLSVFTTVTIGPEPFVPADSIS